MTLQENFKNHSKQYIFLNNEILLKEREKTYKKIFSNNFDKKNNESLKNIKLSELNSFNYYYYPSKEKPSVNILSKDFYEINVVNGKCCNFEDENIFCRDINSDDYFRFTDNVRNLDDIIVDLNKVFLNSL